MLTYVPASLKHSTWTSLTRHQLCCLFTVSGFVVSCFILKFCLSCFAFHFLPLSVFLLFFAPHLWRVSYHPVYWSPRLPPLSLQVSLFWSICLRFLFWFVPSRICNVLTVFYSLICLCLLFLLIPFVSHMLFFWILYWCSLDFSFN